IALQLPMSLSVQRWTANHDCVSVNYGPLTFSLKIDERYERVDSTATAMGDSHWQKDADPSVWPAFEIHPTTPWNYGLVLQDEQPDKSFEIVRSAWPTDDFPFTPDSAPIALKAKARQVPEWTLDQYGLCATQQDSPVFSSEPVQEVTLIPMGAARLRVSAFPTIGEGPEAHHWTPSLTKQ
ncbi:MAG TPA: hypothetical protein VL527_07945, partial [Dongiaceae bacterium]|nr:hypothetical protein [Dongiaceae bacterium]